MKRTYLLIALVALGATSMMAQQHDPISTGVGGVITIAGETHTVVSQDSMSVSETANKVALQPLPEWKQKLYYGYNFDIYYHNDSRRQSTDKGWSITVEPEIGWKLKERVHLGLRVGGSFQSTYSTYNINSWDMDADEQRVETKDLRVKQGSWSVTPYVRYRLKTLFNGKVGIWLEAHLYTGMEFPSVPADAAEGTDYEGLRYSVIYGAQVSPVITYQFSRKRNFQIFFSILSLGYSGTTFCYADRKEYTNDVIVFSGKLRNLMANQFTPGLYGLKFGVQGSF